MAVCRARPWRLTAPPRHARAEDASAAAKRLKKRPTANNRRFYRISRRMRPRAARRLDFKVSGELPRDGHVLQLDIGGQPGLERRIVFALDQRRQIGAALGRDVEA